MHVTGRVGRRTHWLCSTLLAVAGLAFCGAPAAYAETPETVLVTGSRLAQTGFEASTPVTVIGAEEIKFTGTLDIDTLLNSSPQFVGATNGGSTANTVQPNGGSGGTFVNLRGLGPVRNLVLVNGRRFTINGTNLTTDLNTIPTALIERTEIVTGGSSAVYGSDAISGVINFVMKQNFTGARADAHVDFDSDTTTPTYSLDLTLGSNFDHDRGNVAVSMSYLNREPITRAELPYAAANVSDGCVTMASFSKTFPGTPNGASAANCATSGGIMGLVSGGSTSVPNSDMVPLIRPGTPQSNPALNAAYAAAGLSGIGSDGFIWDDAGTTPRPFARPGDLYNLTLLNYMQIPQERWMVNTFAHYDILPEVTAYAEFHFSDNLVTMQLTPSNIGGATILFNTNNPYLSPAMQALFTQLDLAEPAGGITSVEGAQTYHTTPGDGLAAINTSTRYTELGNRINTSDRSALRFAGGFRGQLGSVSQDFLSDLAYDIYYTYARTNETDHNIGGVSRSRLQNAVLSVGGAPPVCDVFGQTMSAACVAAVSISSIYQTKAELAGAQASLTGTAFKLPAGPVEFALGGEWRFTSASFDPDFFLNSGDVAGFNGSSPTKGNETVKEAFGELRVPVLADLPLVRKFTVNGAFRYSDYDLSGVGGVWTYSGGGDWKVVDDLGFRGQYQHAIRAPNVGELFGGTVLNFNTAVDPCSSGQPVAQQTAAVRAICVAQGVPAANVFTGIVQPNPLIGNVTGGNPTLAAEASDTITLGAVITPTMFSGFAASIDYYSIDVKGAIAPLSGGLAGVLNQCYTVVQDASSVYCQSIHRDPTTGQISAPNYVTVGNANLGAIKTEGVDIGAQYAFGIDWGLLTAATDMAISTNWTYQFEAVTTPDATKPNVKNDCIGGFGATCGEPDPRLKGSTRFTWTDGPLALSLRYRFIGSVTDDRYLLPLRNGGAVQALNTLTHPVISDYHYFDLSASYDVTDNLELSGGINNLFDIDPPVLANGASTGYGNTFPSTYDAFGQTFFINLTAKTD
ncbi:MAG: TonB-dependent receptor [Rhizomicrobium sp.]